MKKSNGITLVALVITMIVMILLAVITINAAFGENGVLTNAQRAKVEYEESALTEQVEMILSDAANQKFELTEEEEIEIAKLPTEEARKKAREEILDQKFIDYVNEKIDEQGITEYAHAKKDSKGISITYGKYDQNVKTNYLTRDYKKLDGIEVVLADPNEWTLTENHKGVVYHGNAPHVKVPNVIGRYLISEIGEQAFMYNGNLKSVEFCESLLKIHDRAFSHCKELTTIKNWPDTLEYIGEDAFYGCEKLNLQIKFTENMKEVGSRAFYNCKNITANVTDIMITGVDYGAAVFAGCPKITGDIGTAIGILFDENTTKIPDNMFDGMSGLIGTVVIQKSIEEIGENAFRNCTGVTGIDLSQNIVNNKTTLKNIGARAFQQDWRIVGKLNNIHGVEYIGRNAFQGCAFEEVTLPSTLKEVWQEAFYWCRSSLKKVTLNCGDVFYKTAGQSAHSCFASDENLTTVVFGNDCTMTKIPSGFFAVCKALKSISFPYSIKEIEHNSFRDCEELQNVNYSANLETIYANAFKNCAKLISLPVLKDSNGNIIGVISTLKTIEYNAYIDCTQLGYDANNTNPENEEDEYCTYWADLLKNSNVATIGESAFKNCQYLAGYYSGIFYNLTDKIKVGALAFDGTKIKKGLEWKIIDEDNGNKVTYGIIDKELKVISNSEFNGVNLFIEVTIKDGKRESKPITELELPNTITKIDNNAFINCTSITKITIPDSIQYIGAYAFCNCNKLQKVVTNNNLTSIPFYVFEGCSELTDIGTWNNVTKIEGGAFRKCTKLENFTLNDNITHVNKNAFQDCGIKSLIFPASLEFLGDSVFWGAKIENVDLSKTSLEALPDYTFYYSKLKTVTLPNTIKTIGKGAFQCTPMEKINIPNSVTEIGGGVFFMGGIKEITGCANVEKIGISCFEKCRSLQKIEGCTKITEIPESAFEECNALTNLSLSWDKIKLIEKRAFFNCNNMTDSIILTDCTVAADAFDGSKFDVIMKIS